MRVTDEPITWYFDVVSPFAYLALSEVEALAQAGAFIVYKPVLFAGLLKHWGQLGPAEIAPKRIQTYRMCVWKAEQRNIPFRIPPSHPFNPLRIQRLLCALDGSPLAVRSAMNRVWRDGNDPVSDEAWSALCRELDIANADTFIEQRDAKTALRVNTEAAIAAGVFGVPTLGINGEMFWGLDAMPMAKRFLTDTTMFRVGEMARIAQIEDGSALRAR